MSSFSEILIQMGHVCLLKAQDVRVATADQSPLTESFERRAMALKADLMLELATELGELFMQATEQTLSGDFVDGQHHLAGNEAGVLRDTVSDYFAWPIHAAIGEREMV